MLSGMEEDVKRQFGITDPDYYNYLNAHGCYTVDDTNDANDYNEMLNAMSIMGKACTIVTMA